jgi:hypothetical protein
MLDLEPDNFDQALEMLRTEAADHLRLKFRRESFESTSAWVQAVKKEIETVLLPAAERFSKDLPPPVVLELSSFILSDDDIDRELAIEERNDAMIDRAIKRLMHLQTMKPLLNRDSPMEETIKVRKNAPAQRAPGIGICKKRNSREDAGGD